MCTEGLFSFSAGHETLESTGVELKKTCIVLYPQL